MESSGLLVAALTRQQSEINPFLQKIARRTHDIIGINNLRSRLDSGEKLVEYQGFDPTKPNLHVGHLVSLLIHRDFQEAGHIVIFLLGSFTATVGDPSGKTTSRPALTLDQVRANSKTYQEQAGRIIDFNHPTNPIQIKDNYDWLSRMSLSDWFAICQQFTLGRLLERDMFQVMMSKGEPIHMHTLQYPLLQGYDSVEMAVDLEIGGSDQLFNMMVGREMVKGGQQREKFVLTTPLLPLGSGAKMGKTEGGAINLTATPTEMFQGLMLVADDKVIDYLVLLTDVPLDKLLGLEVQIRDNQKLILEVKELLAFEVVKLYHGESAANEAQKDFGLIRQGELPDNISVKEISLDQSISLGELVRRIGLANSRRDAEDQIGQDIISINGSVHSDPKESLDPGFLDGKVIKAGKRRSFQIRIIT